MATLLNSPDARAALFAGGLSASLLIGAYIFQYGFNYPPCTLCYWQRYTHMVVVAASLGIVLTRGIGPVPPKLSSGLLILLLLGCVGTAGYHMGVEFKLWDGPQACSAQGITIPEIDPNDPLAALDGPIRPPACSDIAWSFLGLSMAGWNALISLLGAIGVWWLGFKANRVQS